MKNWQMEYYVSGLRVHFIVYAASFEDAVAKGDQMVRSLRRIGTYESFRR